MSEHDITAKLDELITAVRSESMPTSRRWIDAAGIAAMLGFSPRQVAERIVCKPDFPKPFRLGGHGHPRWRMSEVEEWIERQRRAA